MCENYLFSHKICETLLHLYEKTLKLFYIFSIIITELYHFFIHFLIYCIFFITVYKRILIPFQLLIKLQLLITERKVKMMYSSRKTNFIPSI